MTILPRTRGGWVVLLIVIAISAAVGSMVAPASGAIAFGLMALVLGSLAVSFGEAWRADVWRRTRPPDSIAPGQALDYLAWWIRRGRRRR